jgi:hypothetical protein
MTTPTKSLLQRICNKMGYLVRQNIGQRSHSMAFLAKYQKLSTWVKAYPNASEEACRKFLITNKDMILEMLSVRHDEKFIREINNLNLN